MAKKTSVKQSLAFFFLHYQQHTSSFMLGLKRLSSIRKKFNLSIKYKKTKNWMSRVDDEFSVNVTIKWLSHLSILVGWFAFLCILIGGEFIEAIWEQVFSRKCICSVRTQKSKTLMHSVHSLTTKLGCLLGYFWNLIEMGIIEI